MDVQKIANISVIQAAVTPVSPISPDKELNLLVSLMLGVVIGFGWGLVVDLRQRQREGVPAVVPADQDTLVAPGTVHWRKPVPEAEVRSDEVKEAPGPNASKGSGA
jgi:hypothetical protein